MQSSLEGKASGCKASEQCPNQMPATNPPSIPLTKGNPAEASETPLEPSFTLFQELPAELRLAIWEFAFLNQSEARITWINSKRKRLHLPDNSHLDLWYISTTPRPIRAPNLEALDVQRTIIKPLLRKRLDAWFGGLPPFVHHPDDLHVTANLEIDTISINSSDYTVFSNFMDYSSIRHLALGIQMSGRARDETIPPFKRLTLFTELPNLRNLKLVVGRKEVPATYDGCKPHYRLVDITSESTFLEHLGPRDRMWYNDQRLKSVRNLVYIVYMLNLYGRIFS